MATANIERMATYALTREKQKKTIANKWDLMKGKLLKGPTFEVLTDFISNNMSLILNLEEMPPTRSSTSGPSLYFEPSPLPSRRPAYVVGFKKRGDRSEALEELRQADDVEFFELSERIANWFKEELFWPKTYLFVTQISVSDGGFSDRLTGILATNLAYGELAEHTERVVEQIKQGVISKKIRKGIIYPHIVRRNGKITIEHKCKVYEQRTVPAHYWYEFLGLEAPYYWQELAESTFYEQEKKGKLRSLPEFAQALKRKEIKAPELATIRIILDETKVRTPLSEIGNKLKLTRLREHYVALIKGERFKVLLGKADLVQAGLVPFEEVSSLAEEFAKVRRHRVRKS